MIKHAKVIYDQTHQMVELGSTVVIRRVKHGRAKRGVHIGRFNRADPMNQRISNESPIGAALWTTKRGMRRFCRPGRKGDVCKIVIFGR